MKIAFVAAQDPATAVRFFSGIPYHLYWALADHAEVIPLIVTVSGPPAGWQLYNRVIGKLTGRQARWGMRPEVMRQLAEETAHRAKAAGADVVLTVGQGHLVFWDSPLPAATFSDILYGSVPKGGFQDGGEIARDMNLQQAQQMKAYAQQAIDRAVRVFATSDFIVDGARRYGTDIPADKVVITQIGANFRTPPAKNLERSPTPPLKLLWLGTQWERKGGPEAVQVLDGLMGLGVEAELHLIGTSPESISHPHIIRHGFLRKDVAEENGRLETIYRQSHLLLLPTQKDFTPSGLAEAAAYGVPAVTTPVGGIPGMFAEDEVLLLPFDRYVENAPGTIVDLMENGRLAQMAERVRRRYETTLNWDVVAQKIISELKMALNSGG